MPVQLARTVHRYGPGIKELMGKGWKFEFHDHMKPYYYYTITLTRPRKEGPVDSIKVDQQWNEFMKSVPILKEGNLGQYEKDDD